MRATPPPAMSCFMPWDFAPGLSWPYPSRRLMTPQIPRPAPRAITRVCRVVTADVKNAIRFVAGAGTCIAHRPLTQDLQLSFQSVDFESGRFVLRVLYCHKFSPVRLEWAYLLRLRRFRIRRRSLRDGALAWSRGSAQCRNGFRSRHRRDNGSLDAA